MEFTKFFETGGLVVLPLLFISVISLYLIIDLIIINLKSHNNIKKINNNQVISLSFDPVSIAVMAEREERDSILKFELQKIERKTSFLSVIASVAPLVGLLGTVSGMIKIFGMVSLQKPTNPLQALSGGISEALFATAGGLIIAIICAFAYHFLINSLDSVNDKLNIFWSKNNSDNMK